jgi:hypothetical protein
MNKVPLEVHVGTTNDGFGKFAAFASGWLGSKWAFAAAGLNILFGRLPDRFFTTRHMATCH